jgi:predicted PurR-regulated permease PerM
MWRTKHEQAKQESIKELERLKNDTNKKISELTISASKELATYKTAWDIQITQITATTESQFDSMASSTLSTGVNLVSNLIAGIDAMKQPLQSKINEIQAMLSKISSGFSAIGGSSALNATVNGVVSAVGLASSNPIVKTATSLIINNNGTVVGSNGMKELANTVSQVISGKFGLSIGGKF